MAESKDPKASDAPKQISRTERLHYIGFDVFPGAGKELFASDAEREKYVSEVQKKRSSGNIIRDACTLLGDRISFGERLVLTAAAILTIGSLFLPWYSVYNEFVEDAVIETSLIETQAGADSLALAGVGDSLNAFPGRIAGAESQPGAASDLAQSETPAARTVANPTAVITANEAEVTGAGIRGNEEIKTLRQFKVSVRREYSEVRGYESFVKLGSLSSHLFSAGIVIVVSALLMFAYALLCILFPVFIIYNVFMLKGDADDVALKLKKVFSYGWIPVLIFVATMFLSMIGGSYGPTTVGTFESLGDSYGIGVFLGMLSWGALISLVGFVIIAVKGVEI